MVSETTAATAPAAELQKPKRAQTAYWIFSNTMRDQVMTELKAKNEGKCKFGDIAKELSSQWAALGDGQKKTYEEKAAADKKRYDDEMRTYKESSGPSFAAASPDEPPKPKKALSAYWIFTNTMRDEVTKQLKEKSEGKCKLGDIAKELSSRWAALGEEEKKTYEEKAAADKARYDDEMRAYQELCDPAAALRKRYEHLIPKKPATAASRYQQDATVREQAAQQLGTEATPKQVDVKVKEMWKAADDKERKPFEEQAAREKEQFFEQQKAWQATPEFAEIEKAEKEQEERQKAASAGGEDGAAKEAVEEAGEAAKKKRGRQAKAAGDTETTPSKTATPTARASKRQQDKESTPASEPKRAKKSTKAPSPGLMLDAAVVEEAAKLDLEAALRNLAARPDIAESGKKPEDLLAALRASSGLVNPAKRALLGA